MADKAALSQQDSVTAALARGRGRGTPTGVEERTPTWAASDESTERLYDIELAEGPLSSQTEYYMRFVPEKYSQVHPLDVLTFTNFASFPVPSSVISNLPLQLQNTLQKQNYVACTGIYSQDAQQFYALSSGWNQSEETTDTAEQLVHLIDQQGLSPVQALDRVLYDETDLDTADIAELRNIQERTVHKSLRRSKDK